MDIDSFRTYTAWHDHVNRQRYETPADPWEPILVDPTAVTRGVARLGLWGLGRVEGGDWDRGEAVFRLAETPIYSGLEQRFAAGRDWEDTALYAEAASEFADGGRVRDYETLTAFRERRLAYLDGLYERIRREGYRPNSEASHDNPAAADNAFEDAYPHHFEPMVVVGRDGELFAVEGYHRMAIASLLELDAVAVQVVCRHAKWQARRDRVAAASADESGGPDGRTDHPDLPPGRS